MKSTFFFVVSIVLGVILWYGHGTVVRAEYQSNDYILDGVGWRSIPADGESGSYSMSGSAGFGQGSGDTSSDTLRAGTSEQAVLPIPPAPILSVVTGQAGTLHIQVRIGDNDPHVQVQVRLTDANQQTTYVAPSGQTTDPTSWGAYVAWGSTAGQDIGNLDPIGYTAQVRVREDDFSISEWSALSAVVTPLSVSSEPIVIPFIGISIPPSIISLIGNLQKIVTEGSAISNIAKVVTAILVPLTALAVLSQLATAGGFAIQLLFELFARVFSGLVSSLQFFGFYKKRRVFGVVYDGTTRKPLPGATVEVLSPDTRRLLDTQTTDEKGQYYFLDDARTSYLIRVSHPQFTPFERVVRGRVNMPIFLGMQLEYDTVQLAKHARRVRLVEVVNAVRLALLLFGTAVWGILFVGELHNWVGYTLGGYYVIAWLLELYVRRQPRPYGLVVNAATRKPIGMVVVRIARQDGEVISTLVCDENGRFRTWLRPGVYSFSFSKVGFIAVKLAATHINRSLKSLEVTAELRPQ